MAGQQDTQPTIQTEKQRRAGQTREAVIIADQHPHVGEKGKLTRQKIDNTPFMIMKLDNCEHGVTECAVALADIRIIGSGRVAREQMERGLTPKQMKFVRRYASGESGAEAAMQVYDTDDRNTARAIAAENLSKPNVRDAIDRAMRNAGITMENAIEPIADALSADDLDMRLKGSDRALKLMGAFQTADRDAGNGNTFNFKGNAQVFIKQDGANANN